MVQLAGVVVLVLGQAETMLEVLVVVVRVGQVLLCAALRRPTVLGVAQIELGEFGFPLRRGGRLRVCNEHPDRFSRGCSWCSRSS